MRYSLVVLVLALLASLVACDNGSLEQEATSYMTVYNNATGVQLATGNAIHGVLNMRVGDSVQLRVRRTVTDPDVGTTTTDVTNEVDYNSSSLIVATVSQNGTSSPGIVTAISPGLAVIDVIFRDEGGDASKDDHAFVDVSVLPASTP